MQFKEFVLFFLEGTTAGQWLL